MRKPRHFLSLIAVSFCFLFAGPIAVAAQDASPEPTDCPSASVEDNIALVRELHDAITIADEETIDRILADDYTHNQNRYGLPDDPTSNEDEINLAMRLQEFYANSTQEVIDIFGTENKVVVESLWTITEHNITGENVVLDTPIEVRSISIFTIECGEIVSMNTLVDELTLLVGLGAVTIPSMEMATPAP